MPVKRKPKVPVEFSRNKNSEKVVTRNLLDGYKAEGSRGEALIEQIMKTKLKKASRVGLIQIGSMLGELIGIKFPRNFKRRRDLIVKWFEDNEELILPYIPFLTIEFRDVNVLAAKGSDSDDN